MLPKRVMVLKNGSVRLKQAVGAIKKGKWRGTKKRVVARDEKWGIRMKMGGRGRNWVAEAEHGRWKQEMGDEGRRRPLEAENGQWWQKTASRYGK